MNNSDPVIAMPKPPVRTLAELAAHLELSLSTVAKALAGDAKIAAKTRARVATAARELGYQPNPAAALMAKLRRRSGTKTAGQLQVMLIGADRDMLALEQWNSVCQEAGVEGAWEVWPTDTEPEKFLQQLWHRGFSGLLLWMEKLPKWPEANRSKIWQRFAVVKLQRIRPELAFNLVRHDAFDYTLLALRKSMEKARHKICVVLAETESPDDDLARLGAVLAFCEKKSQTGIQIVWRYWSGSLAQPDAEVLNWLTREDPDVILFYHYYMAQVLHTLGWPQNFQPRLHAILHAPDYPYLPMPMAGCAISEHSHLTEALGMLLEMIGQGKRGFPERIVEHIIEPVWVE